MEVRVRVRVRARARARVAVCAREAAGGGGCVVTCISLSELFGLRKTLKRVEKILRVVVTCEGRRGGCGAVGWKGVRRGEAR